MDVENLPCTSGRGEGRTFRVGCALLPKKVSRYLTSAMYTVAHSRGVELVLLDHNRSLLDQGEYDAIVHKLRPNKEWERNLQEYIAARPGVKVIDSLAGIRIVHNRATMLLPLRERPEGITLQRPNWANGGGCSCARIQSPPQVEIGEGTSLAEAEALLQRAGLRPPLLVKPLWTDGREGSHGLAVLHNMAALGRVLHGVVSSALKPPLVVQQFVEHGEKLFKVYVLGSRTVVCQRPSLGDSYLSPEARQAGVLTLPRISCKSTYPKGSPEDRLSAGFLYNTVVPARGWRAGGRAGAASCGVAGGDRAGLTPLPRPGELQAEGSGEPDGGGMTSWWISHRGEEDGGEAEVGEGRGGQESSSPPSPERQYTTPQSQHPHHHHHHHQPHSQQGKPQQQRTPGPHERSHERLGRQQRTALDGRRVGPPGALGHPQEQQQQSPCRASSPAVPPDWVTSALAGTLRDKLGLQLFNFDMICPEEQPGLPGERLFYVVDINYFPGVDKIPDFEHIFVDFLTAACVSGPSTTSGGGEAAAAASGNDNAYGDGAETTYWDHVRQRGSGAEADAAMATEVDCDTDLLMTGPGGGEDGVSSVSSEKAERLLGAADAPAPAADAEAQSEAFDMQAAEC